MSSRPPSAMNLRGSDMWRLLGFGEIGTPERRYAVLDPSGVIHWQGAGVEGAMQFILEFKLQTAMERNRNGDLFVHESEWPPPSWSADRHAPPGRSAPR